MSAANSELRIYHSTTDDWEPAIADLYAGLPDDHPAVIAYLARRKARAERAAATLDRILGREQA